MSKANLQRKLMCRVLLPMIIGMILTLLIAYIPFYLSFPSWIDSITDDMIDDRKDTLKTLCSYLSLSASSVMGNPINFNLLSAQLIYSYYNNSIKMRPSFPQVFNYINAFQFNMNQTVLPYGFNNATQTSYDTSMWFLQTTTNAADISNETIAQELTDCTLFDFFIRPIMRTGSLPVNNPVFQRTLYGFDSGLVYANPVEYQNYYITYNDSTNCIYERPYPVPVYIPKCRPWYQQTLNSHLPNAITITEPYLFADNKNIGQTFCAGIWKNNTFQFAACMDYGMTELSSYINVINKGKTTYAFAVSPGGETFVHPHFTSSCVGGAESAKCLSNITDVELLKGSKSEKELFDKDIVPKFSLNLTSISKYKSEGKTIIISIAPVIATVSLDGDSQRVATIGLRLEESTMTDPFETLKQNLNQLLYIEGVALVILIGVILGFCWLLTRYVTQQLIKPMDNLVEILDRLKDGDVDINIEEHYQSCSKELTKLYTVFTKLKIVLRFGKNNYFSEDSEAIMNYAQALSLFLEFRNMEGAGVCYNNLGIIHYRNFRYHEAIECFSKALEAAEALKNRQDLVVKRKYMLATTMMAWRRSDQRTPALMIELIDSYKQNRDFTQAIECLIVVAESTIRNTGDSQGFLEEAESLVQRAPVLKIPKEILQAKIMFCKGLMLVKSGMLRDACNMFINCIASNAIYEPETRKKCLEELGNIYRTYTVNVSFIELLMEDYKEQSKDVVFLIDYSVSMNGNRIQRTLMNVVRVIEGYLKPKDRIAYLTFNNICNIVINLTPCANNVMFLRDQISRWDSPKGSTAFYDGIATSLQEFQAYSIPEESFVPFDTKEVKPEKRVKWILSLIDGEDNCSTHTIRQIKKKIIKANVNLAVIGLGLTSDYQKPIKDLCESTPKGLFIDIKSVSEIDKSFHVLSVLISSRSDNIESLN